MFFMIIFFVIYVIVKHIIVCVVYLLVYIDACMDIPAFQRISAKDFVEHYREDRRLVL